MKANEVCSGPETQDTIIQNDMEKWLKIRRELRL